MIYPESMARALSAGLEDAAGWDGCAHSHATLQPPELRVAELRVQLSIAISLKRIADAIDGTTLGVDISESLAGLTGEITRHRP